MALCASLGGANNWVKIASFCKDHENWLQKQLAIICGIPSHDTFNRVFNLIDPNQFNYWLIIWMESCFPQSFPDELVHMDGKALQAYASESPLTLVRAWSQSLNCTIGSVKVEREIRYFISSLPAHADRILSIVRNHWSIENKLHWPLDRHFDEDHSTVRDTYGAQNFSFLRIVAIAVLQKSQNDRPGRSIATIQQIVNRNPNFLTMNLLNWG